MATMPTAMTLCLDIMVGMLVYAPAWVLCDMAKMHEFVGVAITRLGRGETAVIQLEGWAPSLGTLPLLPASASMVVTLLPIHGPMTAARMLWHWMMFVKRMLSRPLILGERALRPDWTRGCPPCLSRCSNTPKGWPSNGPGMALPRVPLRSPDLMRSDGGSPPGALSPNRFMLLLLRFGPSTAPPSWRLTLNSAATATSARPPTAPTLLREPRITASLTGLAVCLTA